MSSGRPQSTHHGVEGSQFPQTPFILNRKTILKHHVLIGDDPCQIRFMELYTGVKVQAVPVVSDDDILGHEESLLLKVERSSNIRLSTNVKANVGIWSLGLLTRGTAGVTQILKHAMTLMPEVKLVKGALERANEMLVELFPTETGHGQPCIRDVRAGIGAAFWVLTGDIPLEKPPFWKQPWESKDWMPRGVDPSLRLNKLYRDIVGWTYMKDGDPKAGRNFGFTPSRLQYLDKQRPDVALMDATFTLLSAFRQGKVDPYVAALRISRIWA